MTVAAPALRPVHKYDGSMAPNANPRRLLYLVEWRKYLKVRPAAIAEAFDIERESVHRMEREQNRMDAEKIAKYADVLGILPEQLWRPPPTGDANTGDVGLTAAEREAAFTLLSKLANTPARPKSRQRGKP